jgi:hypothetical protein
MQTLISLLLIAATPGPGTGFALFPPERIAPVPHDPASAEIVARASRALGRPPGAIPQLHTEGTLPGHGIRDISLVAKQDQMIALDLAMAWRLTGDRRYLDATARYLDAWASIYRMSFNPIDETGFDTMIVATDLAKAGFSPALREKLAGFWRGMATGYLDAMDAGARNGTSNWQSHRVKLAAIAAFEVDDPSLIARARAAFRRQIAANVLPDGSVTDFQDRDALHYVTYDLDPLLMASAAAKAHGEDWLHWRSDTGSSLALALRWLEPFARGSRTHVEFVGSKVAFDRARAAAGDPEYAPHRWDRANAVRTFAIAALSDRSYRAMTAELVAATGRKPSAWLTLLDRSSP